MSTSSECHTERLCSLVILFKLIVIKRFFVEQTVLCGTGGTLSLEPVGICIVSGHQEFYALHSAWPVCPLFCLRNFQAKELH